MAKLYLLATKNLNVNIHFEVRSVPMPPEFIKGHGFRNFFVSTTFA